MGIIKLHQTEQEQKENLEQQVNWGLHPFSQKTMQANEKPQQLSFIKCDSEQEGISHDQEMQDVHEQMQQLESSDNISKSL